MCCRGHSVIDKVRHEMYAVGNSFLRHLFVVTWAGLFPVFRAKSNRLLNLLLGRVEKAVLCI